MSLLPMLFGKKKNSERTIRTIHTSQFYLFIYLFIIFFVVVYLAIVLGYMSEGIDNIIVPGVFEVL